MSLEHAAHAIGARCSDPSHSFAGVSTDTREPCEGKLFYALRGPNFDGHDHCAAAASKGAAAAVVERRVDANLPTLQVDDTRKALGSLARAWRERFEIPVVGVTGSNGKTTVKEMITSILGLDAPVLATAGNLNNDIGVPQTLFRLDEAHAFAVIEMGANHVGEIAELAALAQPQVGVITLCAPVHLEGFGTIERVAQAKGEIYAALAADGIAVINADDDFANYWRDVAGSRRVIRFGMQASNVEVRASRINRHGVGKGLSFTLHIDGEEHSVSLPLDGRHNVMNALAASAAAQALGCSPSQITAGLAVCHRVNGRLNVMDGIRGAQIIDDTYNASPSSLLAALDVLSIAPGKKILVLGDMGELGPNARQIHAQAGRDAARLGVDYLFTLGDLAAAASIAFGSQGTHFADVEALLESLLAALNADVTVLVKGSRFMRMERVSRRLQGDTERC